MADPSHLPRSASSARLTRGLWLRFLGLVALVGVSIALLLDSPLREQLHPEQLVEWLGALRERPASPLLFLLLYLALSILGVPLVPLMIAGGAVFGTWFGAVLNYAGALLGAAASYGLARALGYEFLSRLLGPRRQFLDRWLTGNSYWALVRLRFVPVPFPITNYGSALLGVPFRMFIAAAATAYVPIMLIWSYFASSLVHVSEGQRAAVIHDLTLASLLLFFLSFVPTRLGRWLAARAERRKQGGSLDQRDSESRSHG